MTGAKVSGSGSTAITINPSTDFIADIDYYILIDATAFDDTNGNSYAGISSTTALNFSTKPGEVFNETVKTLTKNQTVAAINSLNQSLNRISGRMNYLHFVVLVYLLCLVKLHQHPQYSPHQLMLLHLYRCLYLLKILFYHQL